MPQEILLTYDGLHELQAELENLKTQQESKQEELQMVMDAKQAATCRKTASTTKPKASRAN